MKRLKRPLASVIALIVVAAGLAVTPAMSAEAATIPQAGPNPVVINQTNTKDNVTVLTAGSASRPSTMTLAENPQPRYGHVTNFNSSSDFLAWNVNVSSAA